MPVSQRWPWGGSPRPPGGSRLGARPLLPAEVGDRLKEAPAVLLRAVFAGIGQLLLAADRIRARALEPRPPEDREGTALPRPAPGSGPAAPPPRSAAPPPGPAAPRPSPSLPPVPGYDQLSVASLRARLRTLDSATLRALLEYEKAHAGREAVVGMFERRLAKLGSQDG
jgi:hypothetical protein